MKASCGMSTLPNCRIFFLPSFCFHQQLALARDVAAMALRSDVLAQRAVLAWLAMEKAGP
jgi:hypothetical protein